MLYCRRTYRRASGLEPDRQVSSALLRLLPRFQLLPGLQELTRETSGAPRVRQANDEQVALSGQTDDRADRPWLTLGYTAIEPDLGFAAGGKGQLDLLIRMAGDEKGDKSGLLRSEVKAVVVKKDGVELSQQELISYAREKIAGYKTPKSVDFVQTLPRNASGKLLKKDIRAPYWAGMDRQIN